MKILKSILGAVALALMLVGVPILLVRLVGWPFPDHVPSWDELRRTVVQRDFGSTFVMGLLAVIGWVLWLQVLWATIWEVAVNVRRIKNNTRPRQAPLVAAPIGRVVAVAVMSLLALYSSSGSGRALAAGPLHVSNDATVLSISNGGQVGSEIGVRAGGVTTNVTTNGAAQRSSARSSQHAEAGSRSDVRAQSSDIWTVEAGDTLWDIAETTLGDGSRVDDLIALNPDLAPGNLIYPGQQVRLPAGAKARPGSAVQRITSDQVGEQQVGDPLVVVEKGDNLWNLTEDRWGSTDMERIEQLADANDIANPHLIYPGQVVDLTDPSLPPPASPGRQAFDVDIDAASINGLTSSQDGVGSGSNSDIAIPGQPSTGVSANGTQNVDPEDIQLVDEGSQSRFESWETSLLFSAGLIALVEARRRRLWRRCRRYLPGGQAAIELERRMRAAQLRREDESDEVAHWFRGNADRVVRRLSTLGTIAAAEGTTVTAVVASQAEQATVFFTSSLALAEPWTGSGRVWSVDLNRLDAEAEASAARTPAPAMIELGTTAHGDRVFVNIEELGTLEIGGPETASEAITDAIALGLASNEALSSAILIGVGIDQDMLLDHPGALREDDYDAAAARAEQMIGSVRSDQSRASLRGLAPPFGEVWEPAIIIAGADTSRVRSPSMAGVALVSAAPVLGPAHVLAPDGDEWLLRPLGIRLTPIGVEQSESELIAQLTAPAGTASSPIDTDDESAGRVANANLIVETEVFANTDIGPAVEIVSASDIGPEVEVVAEAEVVMESVIEPVADTALSPPTELFGPSPAPGDLVADADLTIQPVLADPVAITPPHPAPPIPEPVGQGVGGDDAGSSSRLTPPPPPWPTESIPKPPVLIRLIGPVEVEADGNALSFQRSKSQELLVWLALHRSASTRTGARGALWNFNIREAAFRNVISDLRQTLDLAAAPAPGETWLERSETELLPLHPAVKTDADIIEEALAEASQLEPAEKVSILRPVADLIRGMPFSDTYYLWPDAEGIVSNLIFVAATTLTELSDAYRSIGELQQAIEVARRGLSIFSGHEGLVASLVTALSAIGDEQGVSEAWVAYEATLSDDAWGPHEPAPALVELYQRTRPKHSVFSPPST